MKQEFRNKAKEIRNKLNTSIISKAIINNIKQWDVYKNAKTVMIFYPIGSEINLLELINDDSKTFVFPIVTGSDMKPVIYNKNKGFKTGAFNIKEPIGDIVKINDIDLILMPALAVDKEGCRLGYGKGYYDRFLKNIKNTATAVPISEHLLFDSIPKEVHDQKADFIITENQIINTSLFQMVFSANIHNIT